MTRPICFLMKAQKPTQAQLEAGNYPKDKLAYRGLTITIENKAGTVRSGVGPGGKPWKTKMVNDYGYVNGSMGVDGDQVDCYIGPDDGAENVFVVHQRKAGDWSKYDEDKVMIGFPSEAAAVAAFKKHYDDPRFLGPVTTMPFDEFKTKVLATKEKPSMIKSAVLFFKSLVPSHARRLKSGKVVQVQAFENNRSARHDLSADEKARQGSLFDELAAHAVSITAEPTKEVPALLKPAVKQDPEAELRAMWNEKGVPKERQDELIAQIAGKAKPGAKVGPFTVLAPKERGDGFNPPTDTPAEHGVFKLQNGSYARFDHGIWYLSKQTANEALKTEITVPGNMSPKDRDSDQAWVFHRGFSRDKFGDPKAISKLGKKVADDGRLTADKVANMKPGATVRDAYGKQYRIHSARHDWAEAHPIVDGKAQVSRDSSVTFHLNPGTAGGYPERNHSPIYEHAEEAAKSAKVVGVKEKKAA